MDNQSIAKVFEEIADILEIQGANAFKVIAYRKAGGVIANLPMDVRIVVEKNPAELKKLPGIGAASYEKIVELVRTGKCEEHELLKKGIPPGLLDILRLRGIGPKKVRQFHIELGVDSIEDLKRAAESRVIRDLPGMGEKSENEILKSIEEFGQFSMERILINEADVEASKLIAYLKELKNIKQIVHAGSLRRMKETIGDIDILVSVDEGADKVMNHFVAYPESIKTVVSGDTKSTIFLKNGIDADLRIVENESFGAALHYFTGSKDHNIRVRDLAKKKGLKVNEYGVFDGDEKVAGEKEEDIFKMVGLPYVIPEIRRDDGEIEYGLKHKKFPDFVEISDIRGDLHMHSNWSDGVNTIADMAKACIEKGYEYMGITDHSSVMPITNGMGKDKIMAQWDEVDELNKEFEGGFKVFKGVEVDILKDGSLDLPDDILARLDYVIASAHIHGRLPFDEQTERIIAAIKNPHVKILGHPSGRLINQRAPMTFDMEKVIKACVEHGVVLEINSSPQRLDLAYNYARIAKNLGARFAVNTDSHSPNGLLNIKYGIGTARRGWLTSNDLINTMDVDRLTKYFG